MATTANDLVDRLAKAPPRVKAVVFVVTAAVLGGLYYYFFYSDLQDQEKSQQATTQQLTKEATDLAARQKQYREMVQERDATAAMIAKYKESFPAASELPSFFRHLQAQALAAGVTLVKWTREPEAPVESYVRVPVTVEVTGTFFQLEKYFKLLRDTPRIISVENLSIGNRTMDGDKEILTAHFRASTFRQADQPVPTTVPGAPAAAAGVKK
jgi:Tfp pilus assembly protein PilO